MNFHIVFCQTRKKFDKYIKINRVRNKVIIDIREQIEEEKIDPTKHKDYFNLIIYTKIVHALKKGKDIYYIPNLQYDNVEIDNLFHYRDVFKPFPGLKFNCLLFYKELISNQEYLDHIIKKMSFFDASQIVEDF